MPRSEAGEAGSLIGGIRSSGIRAKKHVTSTPIDPEPSAEERKRAWQPPVIDTCRFDGNRSSRHSSTPSDRTAEVEGWHGKTKKRRVKKKPLKAKNSAGNNTTPRRCTAGTAIPYLTTPLTDDEFKSLDNAYRIWGAKPEWKGWNKLLPQRTGDFLLAEARRLGLTRRADELGLTVAWDDEEKEAFIASEGINWTGDELNMLIYGYPIRSDTSPDWGIDLPWHTQAERSEVAEMIGLPSKEMMSTLAAAARHLA